MMRIVVDMNHPANVHYFKNFIREMEKRGHDVLITASNKEVSYRLLDNYGFRYVKLGTYGTSLLEKMVNIPLLDIRMYRKVRKFKPDIFLGFGSIRASHVSKMMNKPCIAFDDTEHAKWEQLLYLPFTDAILTPACFKKDLGKKQIRYNGYTELSYLHPRYFKPDPSVLDDIGIGIHEPYILLRFVSWEASHDIGHHGIQDRKKLITLLERFGRVFISSEKALPPDLEGYMLKIAPEKMHDILYFARMYIGEGATMATEAALLGTPSLLISSLAGTMGNFSELEKMYDILYSFTDAEIALQKALEILKNPESKKIWAEKRDRVFREKIDVTALMVSFMENYPRSFFELKNHQQEGDT